jgi:hypothetical protein
MLHSLLDQTVCPVPEQSCRDAKGGPVCEPDACAARLAPPPPESLPPVSPPPMSARRRTARAPPRSRGGAPGIELRGRGSPQGPEKIALYPSARRVVRRHHARGAPRAIIPYWWQTCNPHASDGVFGPAAIVRRRSRFRLEKGIVDRRAAAGDLVSALVWAKPEPPQVATRSLRSGLA